MFSKITRINELQIVSRTQAKAQLNIVDFNDDNELIDGYIASAGNLVENGTNRLLSRCTVELQVLGDQRVINLPFGNADSVTSVRLGTTDLTYEFDDFQECVSITDTTTNLRSDDKVIITYTCGYSEIPKPLECAALILISDFYEHREDLVQFDLSTAPMTSKMLMDQYKINRWL